MPHDVEIDDAERRRLVGSKAERALTSSIAALAIRSALSQSPRIVSKRAVDATESMLQTVDKLVRLRDRVDLDLLFEPDHVVTEAAEPFQAIARAASMGRLGDDKNDLHEILGQLAVLRESVDCDVESRTLRILDKNKAIVFLDILDRLSSKELVEASGEDRSGVSAYAVACR